MRLVFTIVCLFSVVSNVYCAETSWESDKYLISAGIGLMQGHTTYQIGGKIKVDDQTDTLRFPISELEFPLDVYYGSLNADVKVNEKWKLKTGLKINISKDAGKLKDSDWGVWYSQNDGWPDPDSLDIYSESDAELKAFIFDVSARYYFSKQSYTRWKADYFFGGKYTYQKFDFDVSNLDQWSPSLDEQGIDYERLREPGRVLDYEVTKHIPALTIGAEVFTSNKLSLDLLLGYSPFVQVEDRDDHILRGKISKAECDGDAYLVSLAGNYKFDILWSFELRYDYLTIDTEGTQKQVIEEEDFRATLDQKNFSDMNSFEFRVVRSF